ncbi:MAG TPA: hypothetical protein VHH73_07275, partial [Verrucomicrobiae bacterium]|nr:hypothetical protein [Verrucomicrobiae bacterium]
PGGAGGANYNDGRRGSIWKAPALVAGVLVGALLVASRVVDGWRWPPGAFVFVGMIFFAMGLVFNLITRNMDSLAYRVAMGITLVASLGLSWGSLVAWADVNRAAAMYFAVPLVAFVGALIARFRPLGMSRALFATALTHALIMNIVLILMVVRNPHVTSWEPPELRGIAGNTIMLLLFLTAAFLFRKAARAA